MTSACHHYIGIELSVIIFNLCIGCWNSLAEPWDRSSHQSYFLTPLVKARYQSWDFKFQLSSTIWTININRSAGLVFVQDYNFVSLSFCDYLLFFYIHITREDNDQSFFLTTLVEVRDQSWGFQVSIKFNNLNYNHRLLCYFLTVCFLCKDDTDIKPCDGKPINHIRYEDGFPNIHYIDRVCSKLTLLSQIFEQPAATIIGSASPFKVFSKTGQQGLVRFQFPPQLLWDFSVFSSGSPVIQDCKKEVNSVQEIIFVKTQRRHSKKKEPIVCYYDYRYGTHHLTADGKSKYNTNFKTLSSLISLRITIHTIFGYDVWSPSFTMVHRRW